MSQEFSFGIKGGLNLATLTGDDTDDLDSRTSFHIGGVANIPINERVFIQPELLYSGQGSSFDFGGEDIVTQLDYINVPILLGINLIEGLSVQVGPQVGFNINSEITDGDDSEDIDVETIDISAALGAQYKLENGIFFQARYSLGLTDVAEDADVKNGVFGLSVGYFFQ